ncbi:BTB/POZ domain-containing protein 6-like [Paramacrobiotus metropolitanus]|uniref:BTB/POZ domain-containing protein 6-like n=1 Tax=Paramacrobiotus metropolitanus TaxID=2943436 RepID=UPI002445F164|nr:BTB/POZ domain-containing protein 6-like [Paramacrobiotus metropolitanus]
MAESSAAPAEASADWQRAIRENVDLRRQILASGELSDVLFAVGSQHGDVKLFAAHKFILSNGSTVFYTMFHGSLPETGEQPIDVPEILPDAFSNMLTYIYTSSVDNGLKADNVFETIYCADKYSLPLLENLCLTFIKTDLKADNCLMYLENVKRCIHDCVSKAGLEEKCLETVDKFSPAVLQSNYFPTVDLEILKMIVQRDSLSADEHTIYTAVEKWSAEACLRGDLEPSPANRRAVLGEVLFLVRFPLLSNKELANGPMKSVLLLETEFWDMHQYNHATSTTNMRQMPFPTVHRTGSILRFPKGYAEFVPQEEVFVEVGSGQNLFWYPAVVVGMLPSGIISVSRNGGQTRYHCAAYKVVRAVDILKPEQEIKSPITRRYLTAKLIHYHENLNTYTVSIKGEWHSRQFMQLGVSRDQMTEWKTANSSTVFYC